ncbi:MAG: hypothetical protein AAF416_06625 [Pseudomonadota bacterium]
MGERGAIFYRADTSQVGDVTRWTKPATGASGRVGAKEHDGVCASVAHLFSTVTTVTEQLVQARRCRNAEGKQMLAPT